MSWACLLTTNPICRPLEKGCRPLFSPFSALPFSALQRFLRESTLSKRKLLHAGQMATGKGYASLRDSLKNDLLLLSPHERQSSNFGDLLISARSAIKHKQHKSIESIREKIDRLAIKEFNQPIQPAWVLHTDRRPRDLNPWNWTGIIDVQADFSLRYDNDKNIALDRVSQLISFYKEHGIRAFRVNASKTWQDRAFQTQTSRDPIVPFKEQISALQKSKRILKKIELAVDEKIGATQTNRTK